MAMRYNSGLVEEFCAQCGWKCELSHLSIGISGVCTVGRIIREDLQSALYLHKVTLLDILCALESAGEFPYCHFSPRLRKAFWFIHKLRDMSETFP